MRVPLELKRKWNNKCCQCKSNEIINMNMYIAKALLLCWCNLLRGSVTVAHRSRLETGLGAGLGVISGECVELGSEGGVRSGPAAGITGDFAAPIEGDLGVDRHKQMLRTNQRIFSEEGFRAGLGAGLGVKSNYKIFYKCVARYSYELKYD